MIKLKITLGEGIIIALFTACAILLWVNMTNQRQLLSRVDTTKCIKAGQSGILAPVTHEVFFCEKRR